MILSEAVTEANKFRGRIRFWREKAPSVKFIVSECGAVVSACRYHGTDFGAEDFIANDWMVE